jgi:O-antigen/teichoic acid export membrane protein
MMGITLLSLLLTQVDKILLSRLLSLKDYGYYTLAATVASALTILVSPITQAWFPRLTQLVTSDDYPALVRTYHEGAQLVTTIVGSVALVLIFFGDIFLQLWTQNSELSQRTAFLLSLLVIGNLLNSLMWIPYQTQLAYGWTSLTVKINIVAVLFIVPAILWATPRYGMVGTAYCWIILNAGYVLLGVHFMYRRILKAEKGRWYRRDIIYPLLPAIAVAITIRCFVALSIVALSNNLLFQLLTLILIFLCLLCVMILMTSEIRTKLNVSYLLISKLIKH